MRRRPVVASGLKLQRQPGGHHLRATPSFGVWAAGAATMATTGYGCSRIPVLYMASSQGDVRSSSMAYPAVRPPCRNQTSRDLYRLRPDSETRTTSCLLLLDGRRGLHVLLPHRPQNITEHNPAPSPSGHPLLSGPPTGNDIHSCSPREAAPQPNLHANTQHLAAIRRLRAFRYTRPRTT